MIILNENVSILKNSVLTLTKSPASAGCKKYTDKSAIL